MTSLAFEIQIFWTFDDGKKNKTTTQNKNYF